VFHDQPNTLIMTYPKQRDLSLLEHTMNDNATAQNSLACTVESDPCFARECERAAAFATGALQVASRVLVTAALLLFTPIP